MYVDHAVHHVKAMEEKLTRELQLINLQAALSSEIPAVRRFFHAATADAQLCETTHYLRSPLVQTGCFA